MSEVNFFLEVLKEIILMIHINNPANSNLNNIDLRKEIPLILLINFPLANKNMQKALLNQHMQNVILFILKHQANQSLKELA
jgi:hypothetical protein